MTIDFDKCGGLVPAIIQDSTTGKVLMLGYMNAESYARTQETGRAKVAIWATNLPAWYITFWATTKLGAVLVTVN
ncbi:MAG: hypothetical protein IJ956_04240, partial [Akkermansia sp.]|nr:hypothetical protein [Akkermansia sp.]